MERIKKTIEKTLRQERYDRILYNLADSYKPGIERKISFGVTLFWFILIIIDIVLGVKYGDPHKWSVFCTILIFLWFSGIIMSVIISDLLIGIIKNKTKR